MAATPKNGSLGLGVDRGGGPTVDPSSNVLDLVEAAVRRLDDLREAETKRVNDAMAAQEKLAVAESKRIDAIRGVDVAAAAVDREKQAAQAQVLAAQVSQSAETLRALVATNAAGVDLRIGLLEKSQYQISGRSTGLQAGWGWIVGAGGLLFTAIGAFAALVLRH